MSSSRSSKESRPLLHPPVRPPSYNSLHSPPSPTEDAPPLNHVSRVDFFWIVSGLWSAVFLGALDGTFPWICALASLLTLSQQAPSWPRSYRLSEATSTSRNSPRISARPTSSPSVASPPYMVGAYDHSSRPASKLLSGRLSDILGRKGAMLLALTLFGPSRRSRWECLLPDPYQALAQSPVVSLLQWNRSFLPGRSLVWAEAGASLNHPYKYSPSLTPHQVL